LPLIELLIDKIDFSLNEHKINNAFNVSTHQIEDAYSTLVSEVIDTPNLLEINVSFNVQSTYFNQITQVFEPFIEPWRLEIPIFKKEENAVLDISVKSN